MKETVKLSVVDALGIVHECQKESLWKLETWNQSKNPDHEERNTADSGKVTPKINKVIDNFETFTIYK